MNNNNNNNNNNSNKNRVMASIGKMLVILVGLIFANFVTFQHLITKSVYSILAKT